MHLRSEMNYGNIRLCMTLKSADKFTGFGNFTSQPGPGPNPIKPGKTPKPGGFRTGCPGPGHTLSCTVLGAIQWAPQLAVWNQGNWGDLCVLILYRPIEKFHDRCVCISLFTQVSLFTVYNKF